MVLGSTNTIHTIRTLQMRITHLEKIYRDCTLLVEGTMQNEIRRNTQNKKYYYYYKQLQQSYFFVFHMLIIIMLCLGHIMLQKKVAFFPEFVQKRSFLFMAHNKTLMGGHFADFNIFEYLATYCPCWKQLLLTKIHIFIISNKPCLHFHFLLQLRFQALYYYFTILKIVNSALLLSFVE